MTKKKRTGSRIGARRLWAIAAAAVVGCALGSAADKKARQAQTSYAVVAGTVFRDNGMALGGAQVVLTAAGNSEQARKFKKMSEITNSRGEFAFRVPPAPLEYMLEVKAAGYQAQQKTATVGGEGRVDVFFRLEPASK